MRAPAGWRLEESRRLLVPIGGRGMQHELRARVLGAICRDAPRTVTFLRIVPEHANARILREAEREMLRHAEDTLPYLFEVQIVHASDAAGAIVEQASDYDALILGLAPRRPPDQNRWFRPRGGAPSALRHHPTGLLAAKS